MYPCHKAGIRASLIFFYWYAIAYCLTEKKMIKWEGVRDLM